MINRVIWAAIVMATVILTAGFLAGRPMSAHEAYVLPYNFFWNGIKQPFSSRALDALKNPHDVYVALVIALSVALLLGLNFIVRRSAWGKRVNAFFERYAGLGPHFVRYTIASALFFSALSSSFLGPELQERIFLYPHLVQGALFATSIMIAAGFLTELAAIVGIAVFTWSFFVFGSYVMTYLNYLGELIVLALFGMRIFSVDKYMLGPLKRFLFFRKYETTILRVFYGLALIYAGFTVKLLHPDLTIRVINSWHLTKFHWLFPSDPLLITLGGGLAEMVIGLFILIGFEMRLTVLVSLFYITLSLIYFRELVWPHLLLYGISINLLIQPETLTIDSILFNKK